MLGALKQALLPTGPHPRTLLLGPARGVRIDIDFLHETRLYLGMYEVELNRYLRRICRPGIRSFDVGAKHGYDGLLFANLTRASVLSFECDPTACERMRHSFDLNPGLRHLIGIAQATVGDGSGDTMKLDGYAEREFIPDFVKLDVEGAEADVLRGAGGLLRERGPAIIVETHTKSLEEECGELLVEAGYRPLVVHQRTFWKENRPSEHNRWLVAPDRRSLSSADGSV